MGMAMGWLGGPFSSLCLLWRDCGVVGWSILMAASPLASPWDVGWPLLLAMGQLGGPLSWLRPCCCCHGRVGSSLMIMSLLAWPGDGWVVPSHGHISIKVIWPGDSWVVSSPSSFPGHEMVGWSLLMAMTPWSQPVCGTLGWSPIPSDVPVPMQVSSSERCMSRRRTARLTP